MTTEVSICNRALQAIGTRSTIASLTEASVEARNCNLIYADTRDQVMNMAFWNFARKTQLLALLKSAPGTAGNPASTGQNWSSAYPSPPWLFEYTYPNDCLQMRQIVQQVQNLYTGVPFTTAGSNMYPYAVGLGSPFIVATDLIGGAQTSVVLTNQYQAIGIYTMQIVNPNLFGPQFVEALVQALAAKLVIALTGQVSLANTKFAQANALIMQARASDGNEGLTIINNMPDWMTIREDGYFGAAIDTGYTAPYGPLFGTY
jgi:hypothetical protein